MTGNQLRNSEGLTLDAARARDRRYRIAWRHRELRRVAWRERLLTVSAALAFLLLPIPVAFLSNPSLSQVLLVIAWFLVFGTLLHRLVRAALDAWFTAEQMKREAHEER